MRRRLFACSFALTACGSIVPRGDGSDTGGADDLVTSPAVDVTGSFTADDDDANDEVADEAWFDDGFFGDDTSPPRTCGLEDPCYLDILVVVDNSAGMADPQHALVRALVPLVRKIEQAEDIGIAPVDVHMMFTTTDVGNPLCDPFRPDGYAPAMGAPISTGCNERIDRFTPLDPTDVPRPDACTASCIGDVEPTDPYVAFSAYGAPNVSLGPWFDIDGDGIDDSPTAQAVACLAPQGIDGCGYESPLEAMLLALDSNAPWNLGERPFLRPDSAVLIILVSDESDCSFDDPMAVDDQDNWATNPQSGVKEPSSALCWNAGIACEGPDANGVYTSCSATDGPLVPLSSITERLVGDLRELDGRFVAMVPIVGVPPVLVHDSQPPFEPTAGGLADLLYREWRDGPYPQGDILPDDAADGIDAARQTFEYGIGPGCTALDDATGWSMQAIPSPRVQEVCEALDFNDGRGLEQVRCCVESICEPDVSLACIEGWLTIDDLFPTIG